MANGYGYGTGFFYPNFFLYIPAILGLLGVEFILAYKIFVAIFVILILVFAVGSIVGGWMLALIVNTLLCLVIGGAISVIYPAMLHNGIG